jgi:hypothetical protein
MSYTARASTGMIDPERAIMLAPIARRLGESSALPELRLRRAARLHDVPSLPVTDRHEPPGVRDTDQGRRSDGRANSRTASGA